MYTLFVVGKDDAAFSLDARWINEELAEAQARDVSKALGCKVEIYNPLGGLVKTIHPTI